MVPTQHKAVGVIERGRVLFFPCNQGEVRDGSGLHTQKARRERIDLPEDPVALNSPGTGTQGKNDAGISATREACAASPAARALIPMGCGAQALFCRARTWRSARDSQPLHPSAVTGLADLEPSDASGLRLRGRARRSCVRAGLCGYAYAYAYAPLVLVLETSE